MLYEPNTRPGLMMVPGVSLVLPTLLITAESGEFLLIMTSKGD